MRNSPSIAITMGDPAGIGPEIIVKSLQKLPAHCHILIVGDLGHLKKIASRLALNLNLVTVNSVAEAKLLKNQIAVFDLKNVPDSLPSGKASVEGGKASVDYIRFAVDLAIRQEVQAITTAPINKKSMHLAGFKYPGHTELLAELTNTPEVALMLAGKDLRVVLTTTHVALEQVKNLITKEKVERTIRLTDRWLKQIGIENPKIAVTGLNPHSGDGGIFGNEEKEIIQPVIESVQKNNFNVSGPFSADALFGRIYDYNFDAVITMYHDQGMIPIKMASMGQAVNITLGLPIIRTSVDHGTAFDIAGKGVASSNSLLEAIKVATQLSSSTVLAE